MPSIDTTVTSTRVLRCSIQYVVAYWNQRFMGKGNEAETPIQILTDLESDAGEEIKYDLLMELRMEPI